MSAVIKILNNIKRGVSSNIYPLIRLFLVMVLLLISSCSSNNQIPAQNVVVNDLGYKPDIPKIAHSTISEQKADSFAVVDVRSSNIVYENKIKLNAGKDPATGDVAHALNFTEFKKPGNYRIKIKGTEFESVEFRIGSDVYNKLLTKTAESFYYQRCGTQIDVGTKWKHEVCHVRDAAFYSNKQKTRNVTGGWHDAGDYGKYSVNTAVSLSFLLYLYDHKSHAFFDGQLNIPKNDNDIPDLLDETKWALDWLLKMQRSDGAVYHKVQKKLWTGEYLPQNDPDRRYIFEVSSTATADFAAVAALSARLFESINPKFSDKLTNAAQKSWDFLQNHPDIVPQGGFTNPQDVKGGEYGDHSDSDERLWAAVELYRLTGKEEYHDYFLNHYYLEQYKSSYGAHPSPISWKNVKGLGYCSYLDIADKRQNKRAKKYINRELMQYADNLVKRVTHNGYRIVLNEDEYYWGSNSVLLGYAYTLVQAYEFSGEELYREAALDQLHYILGRNPFGISYVTGIGDRAVENPYHQFFMKLNVEKPIPGMVVGGPNNHNQIQEIPLSRYPAKNYEDTEKNYMVNETAINYTAPLVYLAGYFSELGLKKISVVKE